MHFMYPQTELFALFRSWVCHVFAMRRRVVVSRRCTNVWTGEACGLCMSAEQREGRGGRGACMGPLVLTETWERETHAPHFLSPLYQHLALCYFCSLKASDESPATDKCLCLHVFYGPQMIDFIHPPLFFFPCFCFIPVSALRCHKKSYSLWFTLRFPRDGFFGTPERTMVPLVLLKEYIFKRH